MFRRRGQLLLCGPTFIVFALAKIHAQYIGHYDFSRSSRPGWTIIFGLGLCIARYGMGISLVSGRRAIVGTSLASTLLVVVGLSFVELLIGSPFLPRFVILTSICAILVWDLVGRQLAERRRVDKGRRTRVVAVISPGEALLLRDELGSSAEHEAEIVDVIDPLDADGEVGVAARRVCATAIASRADVLILNREAENSVSILDQAAELHAAGVRIRTLSLFYDQWIGKLPLSELQSASLLSDIGEIHHRPYQRAKRLFDIVMGLTGFVILIVFVPVVVLGNRIANAGPLLFTQMRVGKNGKVFRMYKFRTMRCGSETTRWTSADDERITRFGRWLRRTHLDELPQMINVIRGDLSIVGPRPEQPEYVERLSAKSSTYHLRHLVRPGVTGWAQVRYRYGRSDDDASEKLQYEFYYMYHQSLAFDMRIVGRTLREIMMASGQ